MKKVFATLTAFVIAVTMGLSAQAQTQQNPCGPKGAKTATCNPKGGDKKMATCSPKHEKGATCKPKGNKTNSAKAGKSNPCAPKKGNPCNPCGPKKN